MPFELHPNLAAKIFLLDLKLCRVLLEDESAYPWILLVPRRVYIQKMMDLGLEDQIQLMHEMDIGQKVLWQCFAPTQINVAAIGNKTAQLHVHIIARNKSDPAWPGTVWDHPIRSKYSLEEREHISHRLKSSFTQFLPL